MFGVTICVLVASILPTPPAGSDVPRRIDVDCSVHGALEKALTRAGTIGKVDIYLHGTCKGNFVINSEDVTLLDATGDSGLEAPTGDTSDSPVLEIGDVRANVQGLFVKGGQIGILVHGWDSEVFFSQVSVHGQGNYGLFANRGAQVHVLDSTVGDGLYGIVVNADSSINLQRVVVSHCDIGVLLFYGSLAAINDSTIENNRVAGLSVGNRSDANVLGGVFRENGGVHIADDDWSSVTLLNGVALGSEGDATSYALSSSRSASIDTYTTPVIYGNAGAGAGGSLALGNTVLNGDLIVTQFANAHVRNSEIAGVVVCMDGGEAICRQTPTEGAFDCPSPTCGSPTAGVAARVRSAPEIPVIEAPRFEPSSRPRLRR
ncbi:MAG: right-handed parallel beta-helix repeat-containing protein [Acidobacteriia bacterium]|nr:right-handed parallel beta-helix repeat-containing protein [Terriglobia bacterium]